MFNVGLGEGDVGSFPEMYNDPAFLVIQEARPGGGGPMSPVWILKRLLSVFLNACRLLSALPSLSQFGRGRLSLVAISFYALSLLFGPCRLSEFTLAGPHSRESNSFSFPRNLLSLINDLSCHQITTKTFLLSKSINGWQINWGHFKKGEKVKAFPSPLPILPRHYWSYLYQRKQRQTTYHLMTGSVKNVFCWLSVKTKLL